jgi:DNA-binding NtrC family response regulator
VKTRVLQQKDQRTLVMPGARLLVLRGPDKGRAIALEREVTVVGTSSRCDLQLTDETVSRNHFALRAEPDGYVVEDLGSTNGTLLRDRRVRSAFLEWGDRLVLGGTTLRFESQRSWIELPLSGEERFGQLRGQSVAMRRFFSLLEPIAQSDATVLISGETGSGKDLAAQALHERSSRSNGPFVVVDCGALVGTLFDSELFGHERGAFSGAESTRVGAFEEASGGTLFLDEVGELPRDLQPKLLRALGEREVKRLGGNQTIPVDVRVIAATHRDLRADVNRGSFREDLYFRLSVLAVRVPPLRERAEDIPLLAQEFLREVTGDREAKLPAAIVPELTAYNWPGNVRELRNRVEQLALAERELLREPSRARPSNFRSAKEAALDAFERAFVGELLGRTRGNLSEAARQAGMDRVHLTRLARKLGLR